MLSRTSDHTTSLVRAAAAARQDVGWPAAPRRRRRRFVQAADSSSSSPSSSPSSPRCPRLHPPSPPAPAPAPALTPTPAPELAPAPAPTPAPALAAEDFDPDHPFGHCDAWTIGVLRQSFNSLNDSLHRLGRPPVNAPLVESITGYVYAIFRVAEVIRGLP